MMASKSPKMFMCYGGMKKNKTRVFISRTLDQDSPFLQLLQNQNYEVIGQSLIAFEGVSFSQWPDCDWLFFYSANAAYFFDLGLQALGQPWPGKQKLAAMGQGTAKWLLDHHHPVDFVGMGKPADTAKAFLQVAKGQRVLFPRARFSKRSIQQLLGDQIEGIDLIVYHNAPKKELSIPLVDILVFTSPMNVQAYFQHYPKSEKQQIISIGATTTAALSTVGLSIAAEAEIATVQSLAKAVLALGAR